MVEPRHGRRGDLDSSRSMRSGRRGRVWATPLIAPIRACALTGGAARSRSLVTHSRGVGTTPTEPPHRAVDHPRQAPAEAVRWGRADPSDTDHRHREGSVFYGPVAGRTTYTEVAEGLIGADHGSVKRAGQHTYLRAGFLYLLTDCRGRRVVNLVTRSLSKLDPCRRVRWSPVSKSLGWIHRTTTLAVR